MAVLEINHLYKSFGGLTALFDFSMNLENRELVGLIGPNGAGKTTVFNIITGIYLPDRGDIFFYGEDIVGKKPHVICKKGIARTFQNIRLFNELTVLDNVLVSYHKDIQYSIGSAVIRLPWFFAEEERIRRDAEELLEMFGLSQRMMERAGSLPYGEQRRLEIVRALATKPRLLILDEPAAGMNPQETRELMDLIRQIREQYDLTMLLIEHDMSLVMGVCERIYVLDYGRIIAEGPPDAIRSNPRVIEAYLGEEVS